MESFDVRDLIINLYTNIRSKNPIVPFTSSMLSFNTNEDEKEKDELAENLSLDQYPKFTDKVDYPMSLLRTFSFKERMNFFFNKQKFIQVLLPYYNPDEKNIKDEEDSETYYKMTTDRINYNILSMIEILFPTKFPIINDIHTSHELLERTQSSKPFWFNPFEIHYYSYLNISNKKYTIKKNIWINDFLNHPEYRKLLVEYRKLRDWAEEQKQSRENKFEKPEIIIQKNKDEIEKLFTNDLKNEVEKLINEANTNTKTERREFTNDFSSLNDYLKLTFNYDTLKQNINDEGSNPFKWIRSGSQIYRTIKSGDKRQLKNIYEKIKNIIKTIDEIETKIRESDELFEKSTTNARQLNLGKSIEFRKFESILINYKKPNRQTSNMYLQDLLNGIMDDDEKAKRIYKLLDILYKKYILLEKKTDNFLEENDEISVLQYLDIGIAKLGETKKLNREVYIMVDLIDGEVNDENMSQIYCPFMGDYLGNQLQELLSGRNSRYNNWAIDNNRKIFTIEKTEYLGNPMSYELVPKDTRNPIYSKELNIKSDRGSQYNSSNSNSLKNLSILPSNFATYIVANKTKIEVERIIKEIKDNYISDQITNLDSSNVLDFIINRKNVNKESDIEKKLYELITLWNEDSVVHNETVYKSLLNLKNSINSRNDIIKYKLDSDVIKQGGNEKQINLLNRELLLNKLYMVLTEGLISHENKKTVRFRTVLGGSTKKNLHTNNKTRKNR